MMAGQKKTALSTDTLRAEKKVNIENSIADFHKTVKRCTKAYQLNQTERGYIRGVWRYAKTRNQLMTELKKLTFCTVECAIDYLAKSDFMDEKDKEILEEML